MACYFLCFKKRTAYELRISDWSSDVVSSDPRDAAGRFARGAAGAFPRQSGDMIQGRPAAAEQCSDQFRQGLVARPANDVVDIGRADRSFRVQGGEVATPRDRKAGEEIGRASCRERVCQNV